MKSILGGLLAASVLALAALAPAQAEIREKTFRLGLQTNLDTAQGQGVQKFADLVAQKSGGKLKVQIFPGGALGGDLQTISALRGGTVDMTVLATSTLVGLVKEFSLFDLPFAFPSDAAAMAVIDGPFGTRVRAGLAEKGIVSLGYWGAGYRHLTNSRREITKLEDVKGLKIRVLQNPLYVDLWTALGANAVPMPFPEVYTALEQKTVDGQENPLATIVSAKLFEVQKYFSFTRHIYFLTSLQFSKPIWDTLNDDEKKVLTDAAAEAQANWRATTLADDAKLAEQMKASMTMTEIAPAEMARFREAVKPVVEKYSALADPAAVKDFFESLDKFNAKK